MFEVYLEKYKLSIQVINVSFSSVSSALFTLVTKIITSSFILFRRFAAQSIRHGPTSEIGIVTLHLIKSEALEHSIFTGCE